MSHIHELYDFTVSAFIVFEAKVLLMHHKKLDTWLQPGGHIELNEDPEMALWRELEEETGLTTQQLRIVETSKYRPIGISRKNLPMPFDLNVHGYGDDSVHQHIDLCYLMVSNTDSLTLNHESNQLHWFTLDEIEARKSEFLADVYERSKFVLGLKL